MEVKIGDNVDGWCTRCKHVLRHTVESMVRGKIKRTHCNTCGGQHVHRARAPRTRLGAAEQLVEDSKYATLLRGRTAAASKPYSTAGRYAVGEVVSHATFGLGVVIAERESVKIDILFADGPKVLLHGG
jgi:hypothetical protein